MALGITRPRLNDEVELFLEINEASLPPCRLLLRCRQARALAPPSVLEPGTRDLPRESGKWQKRVAFLLQSTASTESALAKK